MKIIDHIQKDDLRIIDDPSEQRASGQFNRCEHLFVELESGKVQTISVKLPLGRFVTFSFINSSDGSENFECCDIHTTAGRPIHLNNRDFFAHAMVGFTVGHNTYDTRKMTEPTTLATLLLSPEHNL